MVITALVIAALWLFDEGGDPAVEIASGIESSNASVYFSSEAIRPEFVDTEREPCSSFETNRNAYFGALHIHTAQSFDAYVFGMRNRPADAYAFARGETIWLPPQDEKGKGTRAVRLSTPLDFAAVTDHAENLGEVLLCMDRESVAYDTLNCKIYRLETPLPVPELLRPIVGLLSLSFHGRERAAGICGEDGTACIEKANTAWEETQVAAEEAYDRSSDCSFTTFVGYEYTLADGASNLHRNVIFANGTVPPSPLSSKNAPRPEDLWSWLQERCIDSDTGCDALAIPHNSNWSNGQMFYPDWFKDRPMEEQVALATLRQKVERLVEVMQVKGDSECRSDLYGVSGAPDEFCNFEKLRLPQERAEDCKEGYGTGGMMLRGCISRWSYARYGLIQGLEEQRKLGVNPFQYGLIAASDTHNATGGAVSEQDYQGQIGQDFSPERRLISNVGVLGKIASSSPVRYNPGGVAGLWAEENTRGSLFAAMHRREAFGTSGPRIVPRFFGGWNYAEDLCQDSAFVEAGYRGGVPMGGTLSAAPSIQHAPVFAVSALRDPSSTGGSLQRIQIIKGWMDDQGVMQQEIYDVAGDQNQGLSVNSKTCEAREPGHASLCTVWRDPTFEPKRSAMYYARVLETPSCRWSTYQCNSLPEDQRPESCSDPTLPKVIQERAWTSPIWYQAQ